MSPPKQYSGEYVAEVVSVDDPERLYRARVRIPDLFGDVPAADLPWATYRLPIGARPNDGPAAPVRQGDLVWVDFPHGGDTRRPRITGSVHHMPGKEPSIPHDAWQGGGALQHKRTEEQPAPDVPGYHEDVVYRQHGVVIQITKNGAFRVTQASSGTAVEISPDGAVVIHGEKDIFMSAEGNCLVDIKGDYELRVGGNMKQSAEGEGSMSSSGDLSVGSAENSLRLHAAGKGSMDGPGGLTLRGPTEIDGATHITSTLDVADNVQSGGSVLDAGGNTNHHSH